MRYLFGLAFALLLSASAAQTPDRENVVRLTPILLDRDHPERREFGALAWLGSWKLTSSSPFFGGISSMHVSHKSFLALSDSAQTFRFVFDGRQSSSPMRLRALPGIFSPENPAPDRDSESMTTDVHTGNVWVGFEASNSIRRFSPGLRLKRAWAAPPAMRGWPSNAGPEAMVRMEDGRFLVLSEEARGPDETTEGLLFPGDPIIHQYEPIRFYYKAPAGFDATDAAQLPDGRILVLNRHFSLMDGVAAALTVIDPRDIAPDRIVAGRLVARLAPPLNIDNMEALSIVSEGDKIIVWIASDDNFNPLQQTLLMKFALDPARIR